VPGDCPQYGGAGTRALLRSGVRADLCINMEHSKQPPSPMSASAS